MKQINPADLVPMDIFISFETVTIDLVYKATNNVFNEVIYREGARLWAHKNLAAITLLTARKLNQEYGYQLELKDCLRTFDAQAAMQETETIKANPEWQIEPNRLLAPPGAGAHPRGLAIDVCVLNKESHPLDMGTEFDELNDKSARDYKDFPTYILKNRTILENTFLKSAAALNLPFLGLPCEWWDFRFPADYFTQYAPLHDKDLPPQMQMVNKTKNSIPDFDDDHFQRLAQEITSLINDVS